MSAEDNTIKAVTIVLKSDRDNSQLAQLARSLRNCAAINHGHTVINIINPDGSIEHFVVRAGLDYAEYKRIVGSYNWSQH